MSQNQLAAKADVPRPTIIVLENGRQQSVSIENAVKLADALGVSVDELARGDRLQSEHAAAIA
jgi:transcriptional regulator with XRE-family HTH domain